MNQVDGMCGHVLYQQNEYYGGSILLFASMQVLLLLSIKGFLHFIAIKLCF